MRFEDVIIAPFMLLRLLFHYYGQVTDAAETVAGSVGKATRCKLLWR